MSYLPFGPLQSLTWANGLSLSRSFDQDYRLTQHSVGPWQATYDYDANSNIDVLENGLFGDLIYDYDELDRLTQEERADLRKEYGYDAVGNRTSKTTTTLNNGQAQNSTTSSLTYASDSNRLIWLDGQAVASDAAGNLTQDRADRELEYDAQGRLSKVKIWGSVAAEYRYNALGQRTHKITGSATTLFLYGQGGQLLGETRYDSLGTRLSSQYYLWLDSMPIGGLTLRFGVNGAVTGTTVFYLHADHLDSPRLATNQSGQEVWRWQSDAFGDGLATSAPNSGLKAINPQLQRIYGTAWAEKKDLDDYLRRIAEAEKRDHRRLGRELDLFHFQEDAPGAVFWHPRGWAVFQELIAYMRRRQQDAGYVEVNSPDVMDRSLWEISGHWHNYREHMFATETEDGRALALKPMNCPGSVLLYRYGLKSYRDLPIRMGEFGKVHRYEPSGALHGLLRVRHFTQDDAHIYCTPAQMDSECRAIVALVLDIYRQFGFEEVRIKLSTRPANRMGDEATRDLLEGALIQALDGMGLAYRRNPGEGAFYGPKLEFVLRDAIGRDWQCGTLRVDMNLPERFGIDYVDEDGQRKRPVMLHRALFGSLERFTGILVEHHAGRLPAWLAPAQAMVLSITEAHAAYAGDVARLLRGAGLRAEADMRNEKIGYKIREQTLQRVPFLLVVGGREAAAGSVAIRTRDGKELGVFGLNEALALLREQAGAPDLAARQSEHAALLRRLIPETATARVPAATAETP